ncbi:hypothetical protein MMC14_005712, partial [Varicellaria rhodocarpa]|nr:hypothetical protein [Varicellaria rhodocarpa]
MENLPSHQYTIVPLLGDEKSHGDSLEESRILPCQHCCRKNTSFWGSCLDVGVTYLGWIIAVVLATTLSISWWSWSSRIDRICLEYTSYHSPALKEIPIAYKEVRFNGSLDFPSIYRGPPSPEVDKAWKRVSELRAINVPISEPALRNLGVDVDSTVILPPEAGGGYMLDLEFPHQLHCLNLLRKVSHWDYYKDIDISFSQKPSVFRMHI